MDDFGWSTQYAAAEPCLPSCPSDDDGLLSAFMCTSFHDGVHHPDGHGNLNISSSPAIPSPVHCHDGVVAPASFMGLDTAAEMLRSVTGTVGDGVLLDAFVAYDVPNVVGGEGPTAQATVSNSNTVFSGYGSTAAGGNISSGESNTCGGGGGQDMEVASSPCAAMSRPAPVHVHTPTTLHRASSNKRKLDKYPATAGTKRASASASSSTSIAFGGTKSRHHQAASGYEPDAEAMAQVKEMIYRAAAMRPVHQLLRHAEPPHHHQSNNNNRSRRKNVRISSDPQTVAARLRRERVSERLRVLQRLVPGGTRMDTASMLDEAASYLRFLKSQLQALESSAGHGNPSSSNGGGGGGHGGNGSSSLLLQNYCYAGNDNLGGGGGGTGSGGSGTVLAFGSRDGIGGYVKSNRTMPL